MTVFYFTDKFYSKPVNIKIINKLPFLFIIAAVNCYSEHGYELTKVRVDKGTSLPKGGTS